MKTQLRITGGSRSVAHQARAVVKKKTAMPIHDERPKEKIHVFGKQLHLPDISAHGSKTEKKKKNSGNSLKKSMAALLNELINEALNATRNGVSVKAKSSGKANLMQGWLKISKADLSSIKTSAADNELARRLFAQTENSMPGSNEKEAAQWISEHKEWLWEKISILRRIVEAKVKVKMPVKSKVKKVTAGKTGK